jgi:phosphate transport system substrate-binding protein
MQLAFKRAMCVVAAVLGAAAVALAQPAGKPPLAVAKVQLNGAGATFPAPLYKRWITEFAKLAPGTAIDYRDVGSSEGVKRFLDGRVDFGASDAAMSDEQMAAAKSGAVLVPTTAGMVVLAYNLPGVSAPLKLSRRTYVDLLAGRIPKWNDARIQALNTEIKLPNKNIVLVVRQDGSGTTAALTGHLNAVSDRWRASGLGVGNLISWPGNVMLAKGNEGVAARIKISEGAIGYVEYGFAQRLGLPVAHLENRAGNFVAPSAPSGEAAIAGNLTRIPGNLRAYIPDPEGEQSYPIVSLTWLLLPAKYSDQNKAAAVKGFLAWALGPGQVHASDLGYIPLPEGLRERARAVADAVQ